MKRSRLLEELDAEATPYAQTPLAQRAVRARPRLGVLLLVGAAGFVLEGALARSAWMLAGALLLALVAWGAWKGRLGAVIAAGFVSVVAFGVSVWLLATAGSAWAERVPLAFLALWALALLPDLVTLMRDAELQNAYGMWARR